MSQHPATGRTLTALQFDDATTFRRAARFAEERKIRAEAPGHLTLIIPISDEQLFEERGFKFREIWIRPEKGSWLQGGTS